MTFDQINAFILDLPIYLLNGMLWLVYALAGSLAALVSAGAATVMALVVDRAVQQLSGSRPLRQGRGESLPITRTAQILTAGVFLIWFGAGRRQEWVPRYPGLAQPCGFLVLERF